MYETWGNIYPHLSLRVGLSIYINHLRPCVIVCQLSCVLGPYFLEHAIVAYSLPDKSKHINFVQVQQSCLVNLGFCIIDHMNTEHLRQLRKTKSLQHPWIELSHTAWYSKSMYAWFWCRAAADLRYYITHTIWLERHRFLQKQAAHQAGFATYLTHLGDFNFQRKPLSSYAILLDGQ